MTIGATHWDQGGRLDSLAGPAPQFFFAPTQLAKRGKEWGREILNDRLDASLSIFVNDSPRWLDVNESTGTTGLQQVYSELVSGNTRPNIGHIFVP